MLLAEALARYGREHTAQGAMGVSLRGAFFDRGWLHPHRRGHALSSRTRILAQSGVGAVRLGETKLAWPLLRFPFAFEGDK
jgi:hypothetical protein